MAGCTIESIFITLEAGQQERKLGILHGNLKLVDAVQARNPKVTVPEAANELFTFERMTLRGAFGGT